MKPQVFNPHDKPVDELPIIYGFNNGPWGSGLATGFEGILLSADGVHLGGHICSDEGWMLSDLGIVEGSRPDRHEKFRELYPDGYAMEFVPSGVIETHSGLNIALAEYKRKEQPSEDSDAPQEKGEADAADDT